MGARLTNAEWWSKGVLECCHSPWRFISFQYVTVAKFCTELEFSNPGKASLPYSSTPSLYALI
jgi:hypothetical protein